MSRPQGFAFPRPKARVDGRRKGPGGRREVLVDGKWIPEEEAMVREPTERQKEVWQAVHEHGTQVAAAKALGIPQQAVQDSLRGYMQRMGLNGPMPGLMDRSVKRTVVPPEPARAPEVITQHEREHAMGMVSGSTPAAPVADGAHKVSSDGHEPGDGAYERRRGPGGAPQLLVRGKWISERSVLAWDAIWRHGRIPPAAKELGMEQGKFERSLERYERAFGLTRPLRAGGYRLAPEPTSDTEASPVEAQPEPEPVVKTGADHAFSMPEPATDALEAKVRSLVVENVKLEQELDEAIGHLADIETSLPALDAPRLRDSRPADWPPYEHGFAVGWMQACLRAIAEAGPLSATDLIELARLGLRYPR